MLSFVWPERNVTYIYFVRNIYIYIYIVIHRQTVSFYQNSSVWLDTQDAQSLDRNQSKFTVRLSLRPLSQQAYHVWLRGLLRYLCINSSSLLFLHFYTLSATRVLNYFEELCERERERERKRQRDRDREREIVGKIRGISFLSFFTPRR